ncbi:MAG: nucleotidyltransferase substrate binding protein [Bdellovibrionota bacterium]
MEKLKLDVSRLRNALASLRRCFNDYKANTNATMQEYIEDACVKRFEFTIETSWKIMKKYLKEVYGVQDRELTINNIFRLMQGYGFIKSWESWKSYYERRNEEYSPKNTKEILNYIGPFLEDVTFLYEKLNFALDK